MNNILFIAHTLNGGIGSVVLSLMKALRKYKSLVLTHSNIAYGERLKNIANCKIFNRSFFYRGNFSLGLIWWVLRHGKHFSILHYHGLWAPSAIAVLIFCYRFGGKTLLSIHGCLGEAAKNKSKYLKKIAYVLFFRHIMAYCDCIHALSKKELLEFQSLQLKKPVAIIPNGIGVNPFIPVDKERCKTKWGILPDKFVILYLGRIEAIKGLDEFIYALEKLNHRVVFLIAGDGEKSYLENCKSLVTQLGLLDSIIFLGPKYGEEKSELFCVADLFVLPSKSEGFPVTVLEAMERALPVLVSNATPIPEIEEFNCGRIVGFGRQNFESALLDFLLMDKEELSAMGISGRQLVIEKFRLERVAEMYEELYDWLLGKVEKPKFVFDKN